MDRSLATMAVWLGPALACWATGEAFVAVAFIGSLLGTLCIWPGVAETSE